MEKKTAILYPAEPFDFRLTAENQPYFRRDANAEIDSGGIYQRLLDLENKLILVTAHPEYYPESHPEKYPESRPEEPSESRTSAPVLTLEIQGEELTPALVDMAKEQTGRLLGVDQDLAPFYQSARGNPGAGPSTAGDPVMAELIQTFYGMHLSRAVSVFEALVQAILGQQLAATVARIIRARLIETYSPRQTFDGQVHYAFPRPESIAGASIEELRGLKLSQRKAEYLQGIARTELDTKGGLDKLQQLPDAEAVEELMALRGVGKWTAQWALGRALGRPDAFPVGDLALRRIVSRLYFGGETLTDEKLEEFSHRWSPYRSYATAYLFAALRAGMG